MTTLQIAMTDEEYLYTKELLIKAQGSFQLDGNKYPMGKTIIKVLEEWARSKDFIKETKQERDQNLALSLFKNEKEEISAAYELITRVEKFPNETNTSALMDLILRLEPYWVLPRGGDAPNLNKSLVIKMKELLEIE